jgi:hypothetical protein
MATALVRPSPRATLDLWGKTTSGIKCARSRPCAREEPTQRLAPESSKYYLTVDVEPAPAGVKPGSVWEVV